MSLYFKSEEDTMKNEIPASICLRLCNNHIIMAFYIDCIHHDSRQQSVITRWLSAIQMVIIQIQSHSPKKHANVYEKCKKKKKKKRFIWQKKKRSLSYAPIRWQVRHSVRHAPSRGSARIQINNLPLIFHFFFFWMISFCLWDCMLQNCDVFFYHQDAVFERNLFHNGHKQ